MWNIYAAIFAASAAGFSLCGSLTMALRKSWLGALVMLFFFAIDILLVFLNLTV